MDPFKNHSSTILGDFFWPEWKIHSGKPIANSKTQDEGKDVIVKVHQKSSCFFFAILHPGLFVLVIINLYNYPSWPETLSKFPTDKKNNSWSFHARDFLEEAMRDNMEIDHGEGSSGFSSRIIAQLFDGNIFKIFDYQQVHKDVPTPHHLRVKVFHSRLWGRRKVAQKIPISSPGVINQFHQNESGPGLISSLVRYHKYDLMGM